MKITGMVLVGDYEPYLRYSINSIKDIVDDIVVFRKYGHQGDLTCMEIPTKVRKKVRFIIQKEQEVNFCGWRNEMLEDMRKNGTDWVLFVDADEIFANADGSPVKREDLETLITNKYKFEEGKESLPDSFDLFTRHFVWNYFTIDARNNGQHYSEQRLFRLPKGKIQCEFQRKVHEVLVWTQKKHGEKPVMYLPKRIRLSAERRAKKTNPYWVITEEEGNKVPMIWHFGHCKGLENIRERYRERDIKENPWHVEGKTTDDKCKEHELFRGSLPCIHYAGKLPKVMKLW